MISVIIPTLNAEAGLAATLDCLERSRSAGWIQEIVVTDGSSTDATAMVALSRGVSLVQGPPGRGQQLRRGVAASSGDWLLILHADTRLLDRWEDSAIAHITDPANAHIAGYGQLRFDDDRPAARRVAWLAMQRARRLGLPYGDQALLISRALYEAVGGFADIPLMEDVALARALGRRRLRALDMVALTSADRYRRDGWLARPLRNLSCLALYLAGVPPERLVRRYNRSPRRPEEPSSAQ